MPTNLIKGAEQGAAQFGGRFEEAIVGGVLAGVVPDAFLGVEFRPVRRQLKPCQLAPVLRKIVIGFLLLVIGGVVPNEIDPVSAPVKGGQEHLLHKGQIGFPRKISFLVQLGEVRVVQAHRAEDFLGVAFPARGNLRLAAPARPGGVERRCLAEGGFVFEHDPRSFVWGVFFRFG